MNGAGRNRSSAGSFVSGLASLRRTELRVWSALAQRGHPSRGAPTFGGARAQPSRFIVGNILFESNSATLAPNHAEVLAALVGFLKSHDFKKLRIEGHTDSVGAAEYNKKLSQRREQEPRAGT